MTFTYFIYIQRTLQIEPSERTLENACGDLSVLKLTAEHQTVSELGMSEWPSHRSFGAFSRRH